MDLARLKFFYHIFRGMFSRLMHVRAHARRHPSAVRVAYDDNYTQESNDRFLFKKRHYFVRGVPQTLPVADYKKFLLACFAEIIQHFGAASVLELGSGRGFNLLSLALLVPRLREAHGIELSPEGVRVAEDNVRHPPLRELAYLTGLSEDAVARRIKEVRFSFVCGSITKEIVPPQSVDVVFSNSVIEQVPRDYPQVFRAAFHAARLGGFWSEPFREAQGWNLFYRLYLKNIDYFCASYREVEKAGWRIHSFEVPLLQKFQFNTGILVCTKPQV